MSRTSTSPQRRKAPAKGAAGASLEEQIVLALFDLSNLLVRRGDQLASVAALTTQEWLVLLQLGGDPNFPVTGPAVASPPLASDIARARGVTRATVSAVVNSLKRRGLVTMTPDAEDARRHRLTVTAEGSQLLAAIQPMREQANQRLLGPLKRAEREAFHGFLLTCLNVLWDLHESERTEVARRQLAQRARRPRLRTR